MPTLPHSYRHCRDLTRRANSSFPLAFRLLRPARRRAMDALYAFMRVTDDLADEPGEHAAKRASLAGWRAGLHAALCGEYSHPVHPALHDTVRRFGVPAEHLFAVIDGVETDLEPVRFATFDDLYPYLFRVASAVGLACLPVWGFRPGATADDARGPGEAAGVAFQLTNILRDLGEDRARGRVYLPADDLVRFGCPPESWPGGGFAEMLRFQVDRARHFYRRSEPLAGMLTAEGRAIFGAMSGTYRSLLDGVEAAGPGVLSRRVRVPAWRKAWGFAAAWPVRWGWV